MTCENCSRLEKRLADLEAKLAQIVGFRVESPPGLPAVPPVNGTAKAPVVSEATTCLPSLSLPTPDQRDRLLALGIRDAEHPNSVKALREHARGLELVAPLIGKSIPGMAVFHAAYAAERCGRDAVESVMTRLYGRYHFEPADILHAAEALKAQGLEATEAAADLGYRRIDILHAAQVVRLWPRAAEGRQELAEMKKLFQRVRADVAGEDLRYCALAWINLGGEFLERAIRDRHPNNEREPWARGMSIPILAWAYRMSAPHTGPAIDECRSKSMRREKVGAEVLSILGRRFGRKVALPPWLGGKQE